jgi:hypothetical protein
MCFVTKVFFLLIGVVSTLPNPHAGGTPRVGCPRLLIQYIRSYPRSRAHNIKKQGTTDQRVGLHGNCARSFWHLVTTRWIDFYYTLEVTKLNDLFYETAHTPMIDQ